MADTAPFGEADDTARGGTEGNTGSSPKRSYRSAEQWLNFLVEANELLASSLDYQTTLASVARLAVPYLGDWCAIDMSADDGSIQRLAIAHVDPARVQWADETHGRFPYELAVRHGVPNVIRTGEPEFLPFIPKELLLRAAKNDEDREILEQIGRISSMSLPLVARGRTLGAITLVTAASEWHYTEEDLRFGLDLARRAAMAVDNALLYGEAYIQREHLKVTLGSIGDAVISTDMRGLITFINPVAAGLTGWSAEEALGRSLEDILVIVNDATRQPVENPVRSVLRRNTAVRSAGHTALVSRDGRSIPIDDSASPIRDAEGDLIGVVMVFHDVAEASLAESALRESESRFRTMADSAPVLIWMSDPDGRSTYFNRSWLEFTGRTMEQELGDGWAEGIHADDREGCLRMYRSAFDARKEFRMEYRRHHIDGDYRWLLDVGIPRFSHDGLFVGYIGSCIDITERRKMEEALRWSESQLRLVINAPPSLICYIDMDRRYRFNNRAYQDWFGIAEDAMIGRHVREVFGDEVYDGVRENLDAALAGHRGEFDVMIPIDGEQHHLRSSYVPDIADDGSVRGVVVLSHDVTVQKRGEQELKKARDDAEEASRARDQFLAVLSHELRTPLTPVLTIVDALEGDPALPEELQPYIEIIRRNVELEAQLIDDLLDITRIVRGKLELSMVNLDLHDLLHDVIEGYRNDSLRKNIDIRFLPRATHYHTLADTVRLYQVFRNLVQNALKFTQEGGHVVVRTSNPDPYRIAITVADDGIGIVPELLPRIFNAFEQGEQTMMRRFGGLGLGLAVSKSLIDMHGGSISAQSDGEGGGAVFTVELNVDPGADDKGERTVEPAPESRGHDRLRILLVDDHEDTSMVLKLLLARQGYEVHTAASVREGIAIASANPFDILISDIGLPDGSGLDLIRELKLHGAVKGIALSGFGMEGDIQRSRDAGFAEHLIKPVSFQKIREVIDRLLASPEV